MNLKTIDNKGAAERWKKQYFRDGEWCEISLKFQSSCQKRTREEIYNTLISIENPTKEQIDSIIGNSSWTDNYCDECGRAVDLTIYFKEPNAGGYHGVFICKDCLEKALKEIEKND